MSQWLVLDLVKNPKQRHNGDPFATFSRVGPACREGKSPESDKGLVDPKSTWRNWPTTSSNFPMAVLSHEYSSTVHRDLLLHGAL